MVVEVVVVDVEVVVAVDDAFDVGVTEDDPGAAPAPVTGAPAGSLPEEERVVQVGCFYFYGVLLFLLRLWLVVFAGHCQLSMVVDDL